MKKSLFAILSALCLALTACGGSAPAGGGDAGTQSQSAEPADTKEEPGTAEGDAAQENADAEAAAAEENTEAEAAPAAVKEPSIVEITMDNWDQYFEIIPVHAAYPYVRAGESAEYTITCNAFELALKDEYTQNYLDNSGYYISDKMLNQSQTFWLNDDEILADFTEKGEVIFPQGAEITATVSFEYDGETLGADNNEHYNPDFVYTDRFSSADGPIEFERTVKIGNRNYRYPAYYYSLQKANIPEPAENAFDFTSTEVQTIDFEKVFGPSNSEIRFNLMKGKVYTHLVSVSSEVSGMPRSEEGMEWEESGEILDHFTVTVKDISGTLPVWE